MGPRVRLNGPLLLGNVSHDADYTSPSSVVYIKRFPCNDGEQTAIRANKRLLVDIVVTRLDDGVILLREDIDLFFWARNVVVGFANGRVPFDPRSPTLCHVHLYVTVLTIFHEVLGRRSS